MSTARRTQLALWVVVVVCLANSLTGILPECLGMLADSNRTMSANSFVKCAGQNEKIRAVPDTDPLFGFSLDDEISCYQHRFDGIKNKVPSDNKYALAYLGDFARPDGGGFKAGPDEAQWLQGYLLTMYSLAPLKLDWRGDSKLAYGIINCDSNHITDVLSRHPELKLRHDFGNGVALFETKTAPRFVDR